jgi:hypothetical protein
MSMWLYPILPKEPLPFFDHWRNHRPIMPWDGGKKVRKKERKPKSNGIYPFKVMEIGESFVMKPPFVAAFNSSIYRCARRRGIKIKVVILDDGTRRVWRIA